GLLRRVTIRDLIPLPHAGGLAYVLILDAEIGSQATVQAWLPIALVDAAEGAPEPADPASLIAQCEGRVSGWICDATEIESVEHALVAFIQSGQTVTGRSEGSLVGVPSA